jgi:predicted anti-sigma-YlaC factor YlaD
MSTCGRLQAQLNSFLDGELDAIHSVGVSAHLDECPDCRRELAALKATRSLLREAAVPDGRQAQSHALRQLRQAADMERSAPNRQVRWHSVLACAAATALLAAVIVQNRIPMRPDFTRNRPPLMLARSVSANGLPSTDELDEMTSLHAAQSFAVPSGDDGVQQTTLADANARLSLRRQ